MKNTLRYILFTLGIFVFSASVFAGEDTDRICADDAKWGKILEKINVSYPGENVYVHESIWKYFYTLDKSNTYNPKGSKRLYYIVNVRGKNEYSGNTRAELYSYDCSSKKPSLLLTTVISATDGGSYYTIDYINNGNLIIAEKLWGSSEGATISLVGYNMYSNKKLFVLKDFGTLLGEGAVEGFVNSKNSWYLYFSSINFLGEGTLFRVDKKTKKIIKL